MIEGEDYTIPFQQMGNRSGLPEHRPTFVHRNQRPGRRILLGVPKAERDNARALLLADLGGIRSPTRCLSRLTRVGRQIHLIFLRC